MPLCADEQVSCKKPRSVNSALLTSPPASGRHRRGSKPNGSISPINARAASEWFGFKRMFQACGTNTDGTRKTANLASRWDVIILPPGSPNTQTLIDGMPMWKNAIPWKNTPDTPNIGTWAETDDIRPGMGLEGVIHLRDFLKGGGLVIGAVSAASFPIEMGFTNGISSASPPRREVDGTLLRTRLVDETSPIAYGVGDNLARVLPE